VFENKVLRRIFGSKRVEETGGGENYAVKSFVLVLAITGVISDHVKEGEVDETLEHMADMRNGYRIIVGKCEGKRPLVRTRRSCEDVMRVRTGLICFRIWISCRIL
jgi:hypothetical protein